MDSFDYWLNSYSIRVQEFEKTVDIANHQISIKQATTICEAISSKASIERRTLELEVRMIKDSLLKNKGKENILELDERLLLSKGNLILKQQRKELFHHGARKCSSSNDHNLARAESTHDAIESSLGSILSVINETQDIGGNTLTQLTEQKSQMKFVNKKVVKIDGALTHSEKLIRKFRKRALGVRYWFSPKRALS